jgi:hypothetical protein
MSRRRGALIAHLANVGSVLYRGSQGFGDSIGWKDDVAVIIKHVAMVAGHGALLRAIQAGALVALCRRRLRSAFASDAAQRAPRAPTMQAGERQWDDHF